MRIAVCVETDGNVAAVTRLLRRLASQRLRGWPELAVLVIVVDTSANGVVGDAVLEMRDALRWPLEYVAEPAPESARRRAIALALERGADRVAFLEATVVPAPHWLQELLGAQVRHEADVVEGPVVPRYAEAVPAWVRRGGFFEVGRRRTGAAVPLARPYNVLVTRELLAAVQVETGAAPSMLAWATGRLAAAPRVVWADRAVVETDVDGERATMRWILRRAFRERAPALPPYAVALGPQGVAPSATRALVRMAEGGFLLSVAVFLGRAGVVHALCRVSRGAGELAAVLRGGGARRAQEPV